MLVKRSLLALVLAGLVVTISARFADAGNVGVGDKIGFTLQATEGQPIESKALAGKIIVVDFWATWCPPCRESTPHIKKLYEEYAPKGVVLLGVTLDRDKGAFEKYVKENDMNWPQQFDNEQKARLAAAWGVSSIPHIFIISPDGELLWRGHPAEMDKHLENAVKTHPPKLNETDRRASAMLALEKAARLVNEKDYAGSLKAIAEVPDEMLEDKVILTRGGKGFIDFLARFSTSNPDKDKIVAAMENNKEAAAKLVKLSKAIKARGITATPKPSENTDKASDDGAAPDTAKLAEARLAAGDRAKDQGQRGAALQHYRFITQRWGDTPSAAKARERIKAMEEEDKASRDLLAKGDAYVAAGDVNKARDTYRNVIATYPGTDAAAQAETMLKKM